MLREYGRWPDRYLEAGHVVVCAERHVLIYIGDQRGPPPDHPAARLAKEWQHGLSDELGIGRPLVGANILFGRGAAASGYDS